MVSRDQSPLVSSLQHQHQHPGHDGRVGGQHQVCQGHHRHQVRENRPGRPGGGWAGEQCHASVNFILSIKFGGGFIIFITIATNI